MNEITLDEILVAAHDIEFSQFDNVQEHIFSKKHDRIMRRIFKRYEKNTAKLRGGVEDKDRPVSHLCWNRKTVIIVLAMILFAVLAGCAAIIYTFGGFKTDVYSDNTLLFPIELEDCPQSIEDTYYLSELPAGFELQDESINDVDIYQIYINYITGQTITFHQSTKTAFSTHYNTEHSELEEINISGHTGVGLQEKDDYIVVWDNGDYVFEVSADLPKSDTLKLAESAKVLVN